MAMPAKRVDFVSVKLVKEGSTAYPQRFIQNPWDAAHFAREFLEDLDREAIVVVCLDVKGQPTSVSTVSIGTLSSAHVHPREIFKPGILSNAAAIILAHNHPTGLATPSKDDIQTTERIVEADKILGIDLLDHIIVGHNGNYTSFKEQGLM